MKLFCFIFSMYVIILCGFPCRDNGEHSDKTFHTEQSTNNAQHDQYCHHCSPFCVCNCCQVNTLTGTKLTLDGIYTTPQILVYRIKEVHLAEVVTPIWQPPKLAC